MAVLQRIPEMTAQRIKKEDKALRQNTAVSESQECKAENGHPLSHMAIRIC
jgi:hypothetical protein